MPEKNNYALLIGINYIGTSAQLGGCQNDVLKMKEVIKTHYGYKEENITLLMDKSGYISPTASNIMAQLNSLYSKSVNGLINEIYIHYSGHGTNVIDGDGDETDGRDECLVPLDYAKSGVITDDLIYSFLSKIKPVKKIIWVFDSCNSASCTDLPYSYTVNNSNQIIKQVLSKRKPIANNKNIFVLSGCLDAKVSYDVSEPDGTPCGLLSYNLRKTLEQFGYTCTITQLLTNIKKGFGPNDQTPVLSVNSNDYGPNTIMFEKPVSTQSTQSTQPTQPIKPLASTINDIRNINNKIRTLGAQFNTFNSRCINMTQEQVNSNIDNFEKQLDDIKINLTKNKI
jgi:hypothetical protein